MRGAWYVVDVYCCMSIFGLFVAMLNSNGNYTLLPITAVVTVTILLLAWRTYRENRLASRILSAYIIFNAVANTWAEVVKLRSVDVYSVYMIGVYIYLIIGAVKLWRIKELPTRFTDPPADPQAHA